MFALYLFFDLVLSNQLQIWFSQIGNFAHQNRKYKIKSCKACNVSQSYKIISISEKHKVISLISIELMYWYELFEVIHRYEYKTN